MTATFYLSSSNFQLISAPFSGTFSSQQFFCTTKTLILKNSKPFNSLSSNATSYFLQNSSFNIKNNNDSNTNDEDSEEDGDEPTSSRSEKTKMPTAPWMKSPLFIPSDEVLDLSKPNQRKKKAYNVESHKPDRSLTEKVSGRRGTKVMKKIVQRIERLKLGNDFGDDTQKKRDSTQKNWDDFGGGFLLGDDEESKLGSKRPWEKEEKLVFRRMKREKVVTAAELSLDEEILKRLRREASKIRKWVKVKKAGVTQAVVDEVQSIWANNELVMVKFDLPLCRNMDRAREIVEIKTGGLVVWSRKDSLLAYRGCDYHSRRWSRKPYVRPAGEGQRSNLSTDDQISDTNSKYLEQSYKPYKMDWEKDSLSDGLLMDRNIDKSLYEREGERLLEDLGPRYIDWWYAKPLPVDGDLLPEVVPGFKPPFRVCPPLVRLQLTDDELTYLRKLARPLPVHFVLGTIFVVVRLSS